MIGVGPPGEPVEIRPVTTKPDQTTTETPPVDAARNATEAPFLITPEDVAELEATIGRAMKGIRDPDAMRRPAERMDRRRMAMPETNIAVDLTRETRDDA